MTNSWINFAPITNHFFHGKALKDKYLISNVIFVDIVLASLLSGCSKCWWPLLALHTEIPQGVIDWLMPMHVNFLAHNRHKYFNWLHRLVFGTSSVSFPVIDLNFSRNVITNSNIIPHKLSSRLYKSWYIHKAHSAILFTSTFFFFKVERTHKNSRPDLITVVWRATWILGSTVPKTGSLLSHNDALTQINEEW